MTVQDTESQEGTAAGGSPKAADERIPVLQGKGLIKTFGRVIGLDGVDIELYPGEVLAVIGDNGAGKSSLIKALSGAVVPDSGEIFLDGQQVHFRSPMDAYTMGLFAVLVAPFMEELLFRGLLYPVIARAAGVGFGIVVTGLLFAVMHASQLGWSWGPVLILFAVGAALTTIRAVTKSVASSMLTHMGYNLTLFSVFFVGTGHFQHMERLSR